MLHSLRDHHALAHQALQKVADRQNSSKQKRRSFLKGGLASLLLISGAGAVWQFKQPGYSEAFETAKGKKVATRCRTALKLPSTQIHK